MRHTLTTLLLTALSAVVLFATPATAQLIGDRVRIDAIRVGVVASRHLDGITLQSGSHYRFDEMKTLEVLAGTKSKAGAGFKVGAAVGFGIGLVGGLATEDACVWERCETSIGQRIGLGVVFGIGLGALGGLVGGILGATVRTENWVPILIQPPGSTAFRFGVRRSLHW